MPPGTPGAPMANTPSSTQNRSMVGTLSSEPYRICDTTMQKNTSVSTDPHRWMLANSGTPKLTMSRLSVFAWPAHSRATPSVAADDMVPTAVRYADP